MSFYIQNPQGTVMPKNAGRNPNPRATMPRYVRVYSALREWIDSGKFSPGEKIASEEEIGQMFGVSRITTRKAIDLLVEDDLVYRLHGKGTYVAENVQQRAGLENVSKRMRVARRVALRSKTDQVEISEIDADPKTCVDLKLSTGARVQRISYVRVIDGDLVAYAVSHVPSDLELKIKPGDLRTESTLTLLDKSGFEPVSANQLISATLADAFITGVLKINMGSPVLRIKQIVLNKNQEPLERFIIHYRSDRYEHPMDLHERRHLDLVHGLTPLRK